MNLHAPSYDGSARCCNECNARFHSGQSILVDRSEPNQAFCAPPNGEARLMWRRLHPGTHKRLTGRQLQYFLKQ